MAEIKYFIGKEANSLYERIGGKREKALELFDYNTEDEILNYFCKSKNPEKINFIPILKFWRQKNCVESVQEKLKVGNIDKIHFDFTDNFKKDVTNMCGLCANTDVVCVGKDFRISVEVRLKESVCLTIREMKIGRAAIVQKIVESWLEAVQDFCKPDLAWIDDLPFKFLLRIVDACVNNSGNAIVLHQFFYKEAFDMRDWLERARIWKSIINPNERLSFYAQAIPIVGVDSYFSTGDFVEKLKLIALLVDAKGAGKEIYFVP